MKMREMPQMRWTFSRYRRLFWDCGLDPYFRLQSLRKRRREEKKARLYRKIGRPTNLAPNGPFARQRLRSTLGAFPMDTSRNETNIAALNQGPREDGRLRLQKASSTKLFEKCVLTMRRMNATYLGLRYKLPTQESTC